MAARNEPLLHPRLGGAALGGRRLVSTGMAAGFGLRRPVCRASGPSWRAMSVLVLLRAVADDSGWPRPAVQIRLSQWW
jgi:hypothetical protein